jgi:hypothetical protein
MGFCYFLVYSGMVSKTTFESDAINIVHAVIDEIKNDREEKHLTILRNIFIPIIPILNSCIISPDNAPFIDNCLRIVQNKITEKLNHYKSNDVVTDVIKILDNIYLTFVDRKKHNIYNYTFDELKIITRHLETIKY